MSPIRNGRLRLTSSRHHLEHLRLVLLVLLLALRGRIGDANLIGPLDLHAAQ